MAYAEETVSKIASKFPGSLAPTKTGAQIAEEKCIAKGWIWDGEKCIKPQEAPKAPQEENKPIQNQIVTSNPKNLPIIKDRFGNQRVAEQGQLANESRAEMTEELQAFGGGQGAAAGIQRQEEQFRRQQENAQIIDQALNIDNQALAEQAQSADVNYLRAITQAVPDMIPDILQALGGAALAVFGGAATVATGGVGAAGGGAAFAIGASQIVSGIKGAYSDLVREVESQKGEFSGAQRQNLEEGKQVLNDIVSARNSGAITRTQSASAWNKQVTTLYQSYYNTQLQQSKNKFIGEDLTEELAEFETYFTGEYLIQLDEYNLALINPEMQNINISDEIKERIIKNIQSNVKNVGS